jgi:hypothetical protein
MFSPGMFEPFEGELEEGLVVRYWPKGHYNPKQTPRIGIIVKRWSQGMADITILPDTDGIVEHFSDVFFIGDKRVFDGNGNLSEAVKRKGMWEPTDMTRFYLETSGKIKPPKPVKTKA